MKIGIYPGSFDPVSLGHLDVVERAAKLFDHLIVVVMHNGAKKPLFTMEQRMDFLKRTTGHIQNVQVDCFDGLLANYAASHGACAIVKGLRAVSDFEYEFQLALGNRVLNDKVDTVFLTTSAQYMYLSSSMIKEIAAHGGPIREFVPAEIHDDLLLAMRKDGEAW